MIDQLQKKFIKICGCAMLGVMAIMFGLIIVLSQNQLNQTMDQLTDRISDTNARNPERVEGDRGNKPDEHRLPKWMNEDTKDSMRFFIAVFDANGNLEQVDISFVSSVDHVKAEQYALKAFNQSQSRGWIGSFRYKTMLQGDETIIVFVDGNMNRVMSWMTVMTVCMVIVGCFLAVFLLIVFFSKRAVKPIAESYEKQKQFITDANHELKTPLTLILTNLDILESEIGQNEWVEDMRSEGEQMSALVNSLVTLTRMDEDQPTTQFVSLDFRALLEQVCENFKSLAEEMHLTLQVEIPEEKRMLEGDPEALRRLLAILLDNAVKYCDADGTIRVTMSDGKHPVLCVENDYQGVDQLQLDKLFDRFYRADPARSNQGSFGIGLSIAQAIVQKHHGKITAYAKNHQVIGFKVVLK